MGSCSIGVTSDRRMLIFSKFVLVFCLVNLIEAINIDGTFSKKQGLSQYGQLQPEPDPPLTPSIQEEPVPEQPIPEQPVPEQEVPEQPVPEQEVPEQPMPEQVVLEQPVP